MGIPMRCPDCRERFHAPRGSEGERVRCPGCHRSCRVPVPEVEEVVEVRPTDDRPRRQAARRGPARSATVWAWVVCGALVGGGLVGGVAFALWPRGKPADTPPVATGPGPDKPPDKPPDPGPVERPRPRLPFDFARNPGAPAPERSTIDHTNPRPRVTRPARTIVGKPRLTHGLACLPDGHHVLTGSFDGSVRVWDLRTGEAVREAPVARRSVSHVALSGDGKRAATGDSEGFIKLWDIATWKEVATCPRKHSGFLTALHLSDEGDRVLYYYVQPGGTPAGVFQWDVATNKVASPRTRDANRPERKGLFYPDGKRVLVARGTANEGSELFLWDPATGKEEPYLSMTDESPRNHLDHLALSGDGERLLLRNSSTLVMVLDTRTAALRRVITLRTWTWGCAAVSPDGKLGVVAGGASSAGQPKDCCAHLIDLTTGQEVARFERADSFQAAVFTPDGRRVVTSGERGELEIWDVP